MQSLINRSVQCILEDVMTTGPEVGYGILASELLFEVIIVRDKESMGKINIGYVSKL